MNIFLIGYMGCGKSTLGRKTSQRMPIKFIDMDSAIEQEQGMSISEIFSQKGELAFRDMEREWLLAQKTQSEHQIIATGGGVPCWGENMDVINSLGVSIYLKLKAESFARRISQRGREKRPLLRGMNDEQLTEFVAQKLEEREPYYLKANIVIECEGKSDDDIIAQIETLIKS